ncbi:hypothetical protein B7Y94_00415 [Candidatus Saccharibacteria bacterium 32-49-12]|nr:MAG: hypothetical protein B7Y94_00415 [Candidatus Saccharibacteria bacterium 32-49-12]
MKTTNKTTKIQQSSRKLTRGLALRQLISQKFLALNHRRLDYLNRRPHRSFKMSRRRDYQRSLDLPGYVQMTVDVVGLLIKNRRIFTGLVLVYAVLTLLLASVMSQDVYSQLTDLVDESRQEGVVGGFAANFALFWGVFTSQLSGSAESSQGGSAQQVIGALLGLYTWLATIWLLRVLLAGKKPHLRDAIYSSGGPVIALMILAFVAVIQLIPASIALIAYSAADSSGLLDQTATLMLFGGGMLLLVTLSLYWLVSTVISMVIATLPGMYPFQALKLAGDIVVGRRMHILLRFGWAAILLLLVWLVVLLPIIMLDGAIKSSIEGLDGMPLVPIAATVMTSFSVVFIASYVYIFYRKMVESDDTKA